MKTPPLPAGGAGGGWHDEWNVWGDPSIDVNGEVAHAEPCDLMFDSRDPRNPGITAEVSAKAFIRAAYGHGQKAWLDGPYLRRRRIFHGAWEDIPVHVPTRGVVLPARQVGDPEPAPSPAD